MIQGKVIQVYESAVAEDGKSGSTEVGAWLTGGTAVNTVSL